MRTILVVLALLLIAVNSDAALLFSDDFNTGPRPEWGNERGTWYGHDGVYDTQYPNNVPPTYSGVTTLTNLRDFVVEVDVNGLSDGGIWLRSTAPGTDGVLLVTGGNGRTYNGLYWHTVQNGGYSGAQGHVSIPGLQGSNAHLRIEVAGDTYTAYCGSYFTSITTNAFYSGSVGLYDYSGQTFDNFSVSAVPVPAALLLFAPGLGAIAAVRRRLTK